MGDGVILILQGIPLNYVCPSPKVTTDKGLEGQNQTSMCAAQMEQGRRQPAELIQAEQVKTEVRDGLRDRHVIF